MKIYLLSIVLCFLHLISFAQLEKGKVLLGGSASFKKAKTEYRFISSTQSSEHKVFNLSLAPDISYLVTNRLAIGLVTPYGYAKYTYTETESVNRSYSIGPMVRYYFPINRWAIFPEVIYTFGWQKFQGQSFDITTGSVVDMITTGEMNLLRAGVGTTYFLSKNVGLEGILFYEKYRGEQENEYLTEIDTSSFNFKLGFQIYL